MELKLINKGKCYAGSGHRPQNLGLTYSDEDHLFLVDFLKKEISKLEDITKGISGMASGFDIAWARALLDLNIPFIAALPFEGQENTWPESAQIYYQFLLSHAEYVYIPYEYYKGNWQYYERDKWMVDNSDKFICLWNSKITKSGTTLTVEYAVRQRKSIINLWDEYINQAKPGDN